MVCVHDLKATTTQDKQGDQKEWYVGAAMSESRSSVS